MKSRLKQYLVVAFALLSVQAFAAEHPELKAFPLAKEGMERVVIVLPHKERGEDDGFRVELIPGKIMLTDGVNRMRIRATIAPRPLKGWGYTYYEITGDDAVMSTMMAAPEGEQQVSRFIQGTSLHIRYNSRLPIVIYAPIGYEIHYRIWDAGITQQAVKG